MVLFKSIKKRFSQKGKDHTENVWQLNRFHSLLVPKLMLRPFLGLHYFYCCLSAVLLPHSKVRPISSLFCVIYGQPCSQRLLVPAIGSLRSENRFAQAGRIAPMPMS